MRFQITGRLLLVVLVAGIGAGVAWWSVPHAPAIYWGWRSSNPVRRGIEKAQSLGCFQCHGPMGISGLPDPGVKAGEVPSWSGGTWMMYVKDEQDVRDFILDGRLQRKPTPQLTGTGDTQAIRMPAYRAFVSARDVEDLIAAYKILSGMVQPAADSPERRGLEIARKWSCFSCHGPSGAGGYPNPGSFTGVIPGWYGADFRDLVRDRSEFDDWVNTGKITRLEQHPIAPYFIRRQRIRMPAYSNLSPSERDDLWSYVQWLNSPTPR